MKAIAITPGTPGPRLSEREEPPLSADDEIKLRVLRVGICGTDREETRGGRARPPDGRQDLVIGHEMLGRVVETGSGVSTVKAGDLAVFTVRRGCGKCVSCVNNRPDMCYTGDYKERGIWGLDGYQTEYVVEKEQYAVRVPEPLEKIGVLCEPLSVAEKAVDEAVRVQAARLPDAGADWISGRHCLVAGLGPIGLLAALVLRLRGAEVYGLDVVDADTLRPQWLSGIGGRYVDGRLVTPEKVDERIGPMDLIVEAAGIPLLAFDLIDALSQNGIYVLTGVPGDDRPIQIPGGELMRRLVLNNQLMAGSVNAALQHFRAAISDLEEALRRWGDHPARLITHSYPYREYAEAFARHEKDEIKAVIEWS
jgi:threonine dehydrogenase-like Zn-dependent dehydrogenase